MNLVGCEGRIGELEGPGGYRHPLQELNALEG